MLIFKEPMSASSRPLRPLRPSSSVHSALRFFLVTRVDILRPWASHGEPVYLRLPTSAGPVKGCHSSTPSSSSIGSLPLFLSPGSLQRWAVGANRCTTQPRV